MRIATWILAVGYFCIFENVLGQERVVEALKAEQPVVVDGNLNEEVWKTGEWSTGFMLLGGEKKAQVQTFFKVAYDDRYLYLGAKMDEPNAKKLRIFEFQRDSPVYQDDALEFMIDPYGEHTDYYQFASNVAGIQLDEERSLSGLLHEFEWNANWIVATKLGAKDWTLEMAIPLAGLRLNERSLGNWGFNVMRDRHAEGVNEYSSYAPMMGSFDEPEHFAILKFPPGILKKYLWKVNGLSEYFLESNSKGEWILKGKVEVQNLGSGQCDFQLIFKQIDQKATQVIGTVDGKLCDGEHREYLFTLPIEKQVPLKLEVQVVDPKNPQNIFHTETRLLDLDYEPIGLSFIDPSYRNVIYSAQNLSEIKFSIRFTLVPEVLEESQLRIQLLSKSNEKIHYESVIPQIALDNIYTIPIKNLGPDNYLVKAELLDKKGEVTYSQEKMIKKLQPILYEWWIDINGKLRKNGEEVMPTGLFRISPEEFAKRKSDYLGIFQGRDNILNEVNAKVYLDQIQKMDAYAVMYPYPNSSFISSINGFGHSLLDMEEIEIRKYVQGLRRHPALMAWVLAFLPSSESVSVQRLKRIYEVVADVDPFHPCVIVISSNRSILDYSQIPDILMPFMRIPFLEGGGPSKPLNLVSRQFDLVNRYKKRGAVFWTCLQAYNQEMLTEVATRAPNFVECRNMLYQSVIKNAEGFFWYHFEQFKNFPAMEKITQFLAQELKLLQSAIIAPTPPNEQLTKTSTILSMSKKAEDDYYIFVVNTVGEKQEIPLKVPVLKGRKTLYVVSEGREISLTGEGIINDTFEPFAVHVYSTKPLSGPTIQ